MKVRSSFVLAAAVVLLAASARLMPYVLGAMGLGDVTKFAAFLWNFSPVTALFLFGGAQFADRRWAYLAPLAAMLVSDFGIGLLLGDMNKGFHVIIPVIYGSYALMIW